MRSLGESSIRYAVGALVLGLAMSAVPLGSATATSGWSVDGKVLVQVRPLPALPKEKVAVLGWFDQDQRPVKLQRRDGSEWRTVDKRRTNIVSRAYFTVRAPVSGSDYYRLYAPPFKAKGKTYPAITTSAHRVWSVPMKARLQTPDVAYRGLPWLLQAIVKPAREGRPVTVQQRRGERWVTVGEGREGERGRTLVNVVPRTGADDRYRVRLGSWHGVAPRLLGEVTVKLAASDFTLINRLRGPAASSVVSVDAVGTRFAWGTVTSFYGVVLNGRSGQLGRIEDAASPSLSADGATLGMTRYYRFSDFDANNFVSVSGPPNYVGPGAPTPNGPSLDSSSDADVSADGQWVVHRAASRSPTGFNGLTVVRLATKEQRQLSTSSGYPSISGDGSIVVFTSSNNALVPGDTSTVDDLFAWRPATGQLTRLVAGVGPGPVDLSADGSRVAFSTAHPLVPEDSDEVADVYAVDVATGALTLVTGQITAPCFDPSISSDGSAIAYIGAGRGGPGDVHRWTPTGTTQVTDLAQSSPVGAYAVDISDDGNHIGFVWGHEDSTADLVVWDRP